MIEYTTGNLLKQDVEALVNTVNCVGVMGRGIALQMKKAFPDNFLDYQRACRDGIVKPGSMHIYKIKSGSHPKYIINFPTKRHWREKSRIEDIEAGLRSLHDLIVEKKIASIALPPLGCGLGGLSWQTVRQLIEKVLMDLSQTRIVVFEPQGAPAAHEMAKDSEKPEMTAGKAALIVLIDRYLKGMLDPFVSLLEIHKLLYFLQEEGEPLNLRFIKAAYGPYAENLRHVLTKIEGHWITGYADGGDQPYKQISLLPGALDMAEPFLYQRLQTARRFERVSELVEGFETPFGLELLSTVHWVIRHEDMRIENEIAEHVYAWGGHKKMFTLRQIGIAIDRLKRKGWVDTLQ